MSSLHETLEKEKAKPIFDDEILLYSVYGNHSNSYGSMRGSMYRSLGNTLKVVPDDIFDLEKEDQLRPNDLGKEE